MPFTVRMGFESFSVQIKLDEIETNVAIDDAMFRKPK